MPGERVVDPSTVRAGKCAAEAMLIFFAAPAERAFGCADVQVVCTFGAMAGDISVGIL